MSLEKEEVIDFKYQTPLKKQQQINLTYFFIGGSSAMKKVIENENVNETVKK